MDKMKQFEEIIARLEKLDNKGMLNDDFFLTWDKSTDELNSVFAVADALRT